MRTYRSALLSLGGLALCASMIAFGTTATPMVAMACPGEAHADEGKCDCGKDKAECEKAKADGSCAGCENCANEDGKACACAPGDDGKCTCGADCPAHHGGKCAKEGAAAPADKKEGGCHGEDKGEGASAAPPGARGMVAAIDPATGELVAPEAARNAGVATSAGIAEPTTGTEAAREVGGGAGTMAAFPENRVQRTVASVDADGNAHIGCQHGAE